MDKEAQGAPHPNKNQTQKEGAAPVKRVPQTPAPVRAIGEDDDGYDPYTDWHDQRPAEPLFERDPWA